VLTEPPTDNDGRTLPYFNKREASFNALCSLVTDRRWLKTLQYYTKFRLSDVLQNLYSSIYIIGHIW